MKRSTKKWMAMVLSAQTLASGGAVQALAAQTPEDAVKVVQNTANRPVSVKPGDLKGRLIDPATQKPWSKRSVELLDAQTGKVLKKVRTGKDGAYGLGEVRPGAYVLRIDGKIEVPLSVSVEASASTLNVAVPTAVMGKAVAGGISWTTVGLVGAGVATAVAVPLGLSSDDDDDDDDTPSASGS